MERHQNQRIKNVCRLLLEVASGNLTFRIPLDGNNKEFDELAKLLNDLVEEMRQAEYVSLYNHQDDNVSCKDTSNTIIEKVQDYILNNLEEPLPSAKELSKMFGTNEFSLKANFRNFLKTSIYQYYNDERLKKAHFLIERTLIPLKEIAYSCGFNDYTNFYKAFKKKYNYSPSDLNRTKNQGGYVD